MLHVTERKGDLEKDTLCLTCILFYIITVRAPTRDTVCSVFISPFSSLSLSLFSILFPYPCLFASFLFTSLFHSFLPFQKYIFIHMQLWIKVSNVAIVLTHAIILIQNFYSIF